jgi:hypothetical protein
MNEQDPQVTCDRSDHDHDSLEDARKCAEHESTPGHRDPDCGICQGQYDI